MSKLLPPGRIEANPCKHCGCTERYKKKPRSCPVCAKRYSKNWRENNREQSREDALERYRLVKRLTEEVRSVP